MTPALGVLSTVVVLAVAPRAADAQQVSPAPNAAAPAPAGEQLPAAPTARVMPTPMATATPRVHHAAISSAAPGERLSVEVNFEHPELIRNAVLVYRTALGEVRAVPFQRSGDAGYAAVIPGEAIKAPGVGYTIEFEQVDGVRMSAFASRDEMHMVSVIEDRTDAQERAALSRLGGRRSVLMASGEYAGFGLTRATTPITCGPSQSSCTAGEMVTPEVDEQYYRLEASYTYRPLRTVAEFGFTLGMVRGRSLVPLQTFDEERYRVGLNFGAARIRFQAVDWLHLEGELLTSITEIGFSVGIGGSALIGDPYGSKIILGFESLGLGDSAPFGNRIFTRLDLVAGERVMVSPIVEVTDMPNAESFGVRLLGEVGIALGRGFGVQLRGGYQARRSTSGGPGFGGSLSYAF